MLEMEKVLINLWMVWATENVCVLKIEDFLAKVEGFVVKVVRFLLKMLIFSVKVLGFLVSWTVELKMVEVFEHMFFEDTKFLASVHQSY